MNFTIDNTINVEKGVSRLKANTIHECQLKEINADDFTGKDGVAYKTITARFQNEEGAIYDHKLFQPTAQEAIVDGTFGKAASDSTNLRFTIQHMIEALNPKLFQQIKDGTTFNIKSWDDMRKFVVKALTPGLNTNIFIKLIADNKGYATMPKYPAGVSKAGDLYLKTRFIASAATHAEKPLLFTESEKTTMENQAKAASVKPTAMKSVDFDKGAGVKDSSGDSFDDI